MTIYSVTSSEFAPYGRVITGYRAQYQAITDALTASTPLPEGTGYVPEEEALQSLPEAAVLAEAALKDPEGAVVPQAVRARARVAATETTISAFFFIGFVLLDVCACRGVTLRRKRPLPGGWRRKTPARIRVPGPSWWRIRDSNPRLPACDAGTLTS